MAEEYKKDHDEGSDEIGIDFSKIKNFFSRKKDKKEVQKEDKVKIEKINETEKIKREEAKEKEVKETKRKIEESKEDVEKEEELTLDFGKITGFFKKKEKPEEETKEEAKTEKEEEEISFNFSKIKSIFKGKESKEEDAIAIDWKKTLEFVKKYQIAILLLILISFSIFIRVQPAYLKVTDYWAKDAVMNNIRSQIKLQIDQQYPNLPDTNKNALVDAELQKIKSQNKKQIDEQIKVTSAYFKTFFQDENGKNYMPDIDPYYWFRYAKNIVEHGHPGDVLKEGRPFDNRQVAPIGRFVVPDMFHAYFLAYFYKALSFFMPNLELMRSMFYYPVLVSALSVLLVFLIARKIAGNIGGFFAGLMMAVNAAFLGRTLFGHADSDAWVVFFPLLITWLFVITIDAKNILKVIFPIVLAGFFTGLYTLAWSGWWYIFDFLLITIALTFLYLVLIKFNDIKKNIRIFFSDISLRDIIIVGPLYFFSTAIFVTLFSGWNTFIRSSIFGPLVFPSIKAPVTASLWPNVLTTVAELNEGSINSIISSMGGLFLFFISLLGLILAISRSEGIKKFDVIYIICVAIFYGFYFLFRKWGINIPVFGLLVWIILPILLRVIVSIYKNDSSYDFKLSILLSLWIISTIFASIKGIRFTLLMAPAFSVAFGVALGKIYLHLSRWLTKELKIHKLIVSSILILFLLGVYVKPAASAIGSASSDMPIINDAWYNTLIAIKQNSSENAIITSWWDFGHHFKALADRPVTFDGTTQTYPAAHWVGKLLMTDNELEAVGILRMLDCGHNSAFDSLYKLNNDTHLSLKILNEIILLDKKEAGKKLKELKFNEEQIEKVLSFTHCNPPEAYFIASEDMIGKSGVWAHFGSWDFEKAEIWQYTRKMPQEQAIEYMVKKFNYTKEKAENIYFEVQAITSDSEANTWISGWPGYGGITRCSKDNNEKNYVCGNGFQVNLSNYDVFGISREGVARPKVAAFTTENGLFKKEFNGITIDFGMTIIPLNENELEIVLSSKELTGSMFTRLFYMQGHGLKYFKSFNHQRGLTGADIYTYKVDWEGKNATIVEEESTTKNLNLTSNNTNTNNPRTNESRQNK